MATPITVTFSGELAEKIQQLASQRQQNIYSLFETLVRQSSHLESAESNQQAETDDVATPEMQAYIALHPLLKKQYFGEYVAIYQNKLIDHDRDHEALYQRIDAQYPDEFVWISPVEEEAIPTLVFRSPRIEWAEPA